MNQPEVVVITDVDGCVLDQATYSHEDADAALDLLRQMHVPVVLCSSKTRSELQRLQQELGLVGPFITENGGAVFSPLGAFPFRLPGAIERAGYDVVELGGPHRDVAELLRRVADRQGIPIRQFRDMSVQDVAEDCGLSLADARLAKLREYDEPFRLATPDSAARTRLCAALRSAGLRCSSGGRYDHVTSGSNKGLAAAVLRRCYRRALGEVTVVGLGDGLNDLELLKAVDVPIVVRGRDEDVAARLAGQVRGSRVTTAWGPAGWAEAIAAILAGPNRNTSAADASWIAHRS